MAQRKKKRKMKNIFPPPNNQIIEIIDVIYQHSNRLVPNSLQNDADNLTQLFFKVLQQNGVHVSMKNLDQIANQIRPTIVKLKNHFNAPRPSQVARKLGLSFKGDYLRSAQTPSYPSGHTAQAYYLAYVLSDSYPQLKSILFETAETVAQSRIDRGVHFPSDIQGGKLLAQLLYP